MQATSFQSAPCASPEAAAASAAAMAALAAPKGMEYKIVNTILQEVNGLFVAVVVVELSELEADAAPDDAVKSQDQPVVSGEENDPENIYFLAGFNSRQLEEFHPFPEVDDAVPAEPPAAPPLEGPGTYMDAPEQAVQTDTQTLAGEAPILAEPLKSDFNDNPAAPSEEPAMAAETQPEPDLTPTEEDDEGTGEGGEGDRRRAREIAENQPAPPAEQVAPAPLT